MPRQHIISYHITSSRPPPPLNLSLSLCCLFFSGTCATHTHTRARRRAQIENSKSWPFVRRDLDAALIYLFLFVGCRAAQNRARHHMCGFVRVGVSEWLPLFYGGLHICRALFFFFSFRKYVILPAASTLLCVLRTCVFVCGTETDIIWCRLVRVLRLQTVSQKAERQMNLIC